MDLKISGKQFLVTGATKGFGGAVTEALIKEGARVVAVARSQDDLNRLKGKHGDLVIPVQGDITQSDTIKKVVEILDENSFTGAVINAGGPPAKQFLETSMEDWDEAYHNILRWKVEITKKVVPLLQKKGYGKLVYIESISTKQPVENLVLSNSVRLSVIGFVKTLSQELAGSGVTMNVLAPGYHDTNALQRLFIKKSEQMNISVDEAREKMVSQTKMGLGDPDDMASLALWLLSPHSKYVTGQTISHDGAVMQGIFG